VAGGIKETCWCVVSPAWLTPPGSTDVLRFVHRASRRATRVLADAFEQARFCPLNRDVAHTVTTGRPADIKLKLGRFPSITLTRFFGGLLDVLRSQDRRQTPNSSRPFSIVERFIGFWVTVAMILWKNSGLDDLGTLHTEAVASFPAP